MKMKNTADRYGLTTILLHWAVALPTIALFPLGKFMVELDYYSPWYHTAPEWHKQVGMVLFLLILLRLLWRFSTPPPGHLPTHQPWEVALAQLVHVLFHLALLTACVSGYLISTAKGAGIDLFGWSEIPSLLQLTEEQAEVTAEIHELATHGLVGLLALHLMGVVKHQLIDRDKTLSRIINPA